MKQVYFLSFLSLLAFLSFNHTASGQTTVKVAEQSFALTPKAEGTYQIQVINSRNQPRIPYNIEEMVVQNRHTSEVKYLTLGTEVRLMILPLSTIEAKDFKPLERIAYIKQ